MTRDNSQRTDLTRRDVTRAAGALGAAGLGGLAGCTGQFGGGGGGGGQQIANQLTVFSWYEQWHQQMLKKFRQRHEGLQTDLTPYGSNSELYSKLKAAGTDSVDFVIPSNNMLIKMRNEDLIQPIDTSLISRWDLQKPVANQQPWSDFLKADGEVWGVPFTQGFYWNIARTEKVGDVVSEDLINSWDLYFSDTDARLGIKDYGRRNVSIVVWHLRGADGDINADPGNAISWTKIEDKLVEMIENAKTIYSSSEGARKLLKNDQVDVINSWGGELVQLKKLSGVSGVGGYFPVEGSNGWFDSFAVPKNAPHKYTSHQYMDFLLKPENQRIEIQVEGNLAVQPGLVEKLSAERRELFGPVLKAIQENGSKLQPYAPDSELQNRATEAWNNAKARAQG